jgi:hypothetical protein
VYNKGEMAKRPRNITMTDELWKKVGKASLTEEFGGSKSAYIAKAIEEKLDRLKVKKK